MVIKWDVTLPKLSGKKKRRAYIYLPEEYETNPNDRYPVLYMFDGHNIFFDSDAAYGKSWGMCDYMLKTRTPLIIVAVECNHTGNMRLREYSPFNHHNGTLGDVKSLGRQYMNWLVHDLKPYIDRTYRTLPERENTMIGGSSMGGLMSLYAISAFNETFGRAACLSASLWIDADASIRMLENANMKKDTVIYLDYGSREIFNHADSAKALVAAADVLSKKNVRLTFRIVPDGSHCEASWEQQIPVFMKCLGF